MNNDTTVLSAFEIGRSAHVITDEIKVGEVVIVIVQGGVVRQMNKSEFNLWNPSSGTGISSVTGNIVNNADPLNPVVTQVQSDWNAISGPSEILNKPTIPAAGVASVIGNPSSLVTGTSMARVVDLINAMENIPGYQPGVDNQVIMIMADTTLMVAPIVPNN